MKEKTQPQEVFWRIIFVAPAGSLTVVVVQKPGYLWKELRSEFGLWSQTASVESQLLHLAPV